MNGTSVVMPAAGRGKRFGSGSNKVFALAAGKPILAHTLYAFERCELVNEIIVVVGSEEVDETKRLAENYGISKIKAVVAGGDHRQDSVEYGLSKVSDNCKTVIVHDGARPLINQDVIKSTIAAAREFGAAVAAVPVIDTIKTSDSDGMVDSTPDRSLLWSIQTPQVFDKELILRAYHQAKADGVYATDDSALVERLGHPVKLVQGTYDNIKVTTPQDLEFAEMRLGGMVERDIRTGLGYDIHRYVPGRKLFLGGVEFHEDEGLEGHSDADVILHAIADALLGAAALGDIGHHFPNTDSQFHQISSIILLQRTAAILSMAGWAPVNVDATLVAEKPKIAARVGEMQQRIGDALGIEPDRVGIKATTAEKLGDIGAGAGAACYAVATVRAR